MKSLSKIHYEAASTLAVIASSNEPLLFLDADLTVIAASRSFCASFQLDPASMFGQTLAEVGMGEWNVPQLMSLLNATAAGFAEVDDYEMDLVRTGQPTRQLVLNAQKLDYGDDAHVRLLLAARDVTDARATALMKDNLLREKTILLQEVQHRVANSLQIIASVLMQSARKVQSDEARGHLKDAEHRILSIAAVQRQLAASQLGNVALRPYITQLCESLGASMIRDPTQLSIRADIDDSSTSAEASISLGLIVTELVINALKHAFPNHLHGKIDVKYRSLRDSWTLSVVDDGIGMPTGPNVAKPGLGTSIVEALAKQLQAKVTISETRSGTMVSVTR